MFTLYLHRATAAGCQLSTAEVWVDFTASEEALWGFIHIIIPSYASSKTGSAWKCQLFKRCSLFTCWIMHVWKVWIGSEFYQELHRYIPGKHTCMPLRLIFLSYLLKWQVQEVTDVKSSLKYWCRVRWKRNDQIWIYSLYIYLYI